MPQSDLEILQASIRDPEIFSRLISRHERRVYGLLFRLCGPYADLDDLYQKVWLRAWLGRSGFKGRSQVSTWICGIAVNVSREDRRSGVRREVPLDPDRHSPSVLPQAIERLLGWDRKKQLERALEKLEPGYREAVVLHFREGLSLQEAAEAAGTRVSSFRVRLHRAVKKLRAYVEED